MSLYLPLELWADTFFFNQINVCFQMMPSFWTWKSIPIGAWQKYGQFHFDWRINTAIHLSDLICYRPPLLFMFPSRRTVWIAFPDPCRGRIFPVSELFFLYIVWNKFSIQYIDFRRWIWYNYPRRVTVSCPQFSRKGEIPFEHGSCQFHWYFQHRVWKWDSLHLIS